VVVAAAVGVKGWLWSLVISVNCWREIIIKNE
jgi:hypothetical protein